MFAFGVYMKNQIVLFAYLFARCIVDEIKYRMR